MKNTLEFTGDFYFFHDGGGWELYRMTSGKVVAKTSDYHMGSHNAANDHFAGADENLDDLKAVDEQTEEALRTLLFADEDDCREGGFYR